MDFQKQRLDHIDIVTSHICNNNCPHCVDKFLWSSTKFIENQTVEKFLNLIRKHTDENLEVLLLGGEPTMMPIRRLIEISEIIHSLGFQALMSSNGKLKKKIISILPYFESIQITVDVDDENTIDFWRKFASKINIKIAADENLTMEKLVRFIENTRDFSRQSVCVYFTPDWKTLLQDPDIWDWINLFNWKQNGSYMYSFHDGVRYKKCIPKKTNVVDEPEVPKVYPNGNYNKTWCHEELDDYLGGNWLES